MTPTDDRAPATRPNIILITTDQERYFAADPAPLPARAWLRARGTTFDRFYGASTACSSARSVIYVGQHAPVTGIVDNVDMASQHDLRTTDATLGTRLRDAGYATAYKGKWHLSRGARAAHANGPVVDVLEPYGFSDYNEVGDDLGGPYEGFESDGRIAADAVQWLATRGASLSAAGTPWFLAVNFVNPHDIMFGTNDRSFIASGALGRLGVKPFVGPPDHERYAATWDLPLEPGRRDPLTAPGRPGAHRELVLAMSAVIGDPAINDDELRRFRDYYVNCLRDVDAAMEVLVAGIERLGLADDTVILLSSDHGELAGAHGLFGKGPCSYDENLRQPLIVVDPAVPGGRQTAAIASQLDLTPTVLAYAGVPAGAPARAGLAGRDLRPVVRGDATSARDSALFAYSGLGLLDGEWMKGWFENLGSGTPMQTPPDYSKQGLQRTVITAQHKFTRYFAPGEHHRPRSLEELFARNTLELFDLDADPEERVNLAWEPDRAATELIEALNRELQAVIDAEIGDDDGSTLPNVPGSPWFRPSPEG